ncbi:hypothetical protein KUH03_00560 [Sphingobacterium sp. E70]|uniref:hypothetical protein n=1 Tax=Sphingobacterium sp. E70 TaxID=2853439 RepID=UPI00211D1083|nr:hypothetical protein [Sphingobacterium sp. E70]ULT25543.1 hypothetical protein KUH03_00560 [Sphingobacterium sp. E70]
MPENKVLSQLTNEELNKKKKQSIGVMISFGVVMFIAIVVLVYLSFKTKSTLFQVLQLPYFVCLYRFM